jgi:Pyruvate/2-oxoacid:ferredoxin oxidoreductase delta subunit
MSVLVISRSREDHAQRRQREDDLAFLAASVGHDVVTLPHLYHLAEDAAVWRTLAALEQGSPVAVLAWLHPRPVQVLLEGHSAWGAGHRAFNLATEDETGLWAEVAAALGQPAGSGAVTEASEPVRNRWYPLVDAERCTQCGRCQQFCIFGVYALDEAGRLGVANPDRCKPGCPACSRVCPHSAIMFPLYGKDPAIAGAPGLVVQPDAATRRMWYQRTGRPCPACARSGAWAAGGPETSCPECGRAGWPIVAKEPADDLDGLIADLDRLDGRGDRHA